MKCTKCGMDLPPAGSYCPNCGTVNERQPTVPPQTNRRKPIVYATAALAALGLMALIMAAVLGRGGQNIAGVPPGGDGPSANVMGVPPGQDSGSGIMAVPPGNGGKGDTTPSATPKPKPTPAMVDYLTYVKKVEEHRQMLLKDTTEALTLSAAGGQAESIMNMFDMADNLDNPEYRDPLQKTKDELARQYKNWLSTLSYFDQKPAPAECRTFAQSYRDVLYRETKAIGDIAASFNSVNMSNSQDISKLLDALQKMKRDPSIQINIDQAAETADKQLDQLSSTYDMPKPFEVPKEQQSGGNIMGF